MPDYSPPNPSPTDPRPALAYVGLGSNLGDRPAHLAAALAAIADLDGVAAVRPSTFHDTAPVGPQDQGRFLNAVAEVRTTLPPRDLLARLLDVESRLGRPPRDQRRRWGPREIDLDLLLYQGHVIHEPGLTLPHPRLHERAFVLLPLAELAPDAIHPVLHCPVRDLVDRLPALPFVESSPPAEVSP